MNLLTLPQARQVDAACDRFEAQWRSGARAPDEAFLVGLPGSRFRILRPHARGGLGEVFIAIDEELHREVALKQMQERHANDSASRARFLQEAEITGRLEHPGIVPVYGLGTYNGGHPY